MAVITGDLGASTQVTTANPSTLSHVGGDMDVMGAGDPADNPDVQPSKLPSETLLKILKNWLNADMQHRQLWSEDCKGWYKFRAGEQWEAEDRQLLNAQQRPAIVFNRVLTILKAVAGMEINGRHEISFIPRNTENTAVNEMLSAASKWMSDGCDAEDEESSAFEDTCTCGMGWTENRISYEDDWKGKYVEERVNPLEMFWDRTCARKNLDGARRLTRVRKMPLRDAMALFPGKDRAQLDAGWAIDDYTGATKTLEEKRRREQNTTESDYNDLLEVTIVHMQWIEHDYYWKVGNLQNGQLTEMTDGEYRMAQVRMLQTGVDPNLVRGVRLPRKLYKQAFLGSEVLQVGDSPVKDQYIWKCITGELDMMAGTWFGLVKIMMDPQRWSNKWLSQILHILNTTAKGGILAEEDVPAGDPREFEEGYARPDVVTWVAKNAIKDQKIMPKPGQGMTEGHVQLMQYAISSIRDTTGINLELLGQQDQNQPGILERYRKQAGMTILATLFDSLRRFRKQVGRIRLYYLQNYLADGRLVRVVGADGVQSLPLLRDKCLGEYDTIVDDTPTSPNMKEANWGIILPLIATFKDQLVANPMVLTKLLEYSPLPNSVVDMLKKFAAQQAQDPEQQQMKQLNIARLVAAINKDQSTAEMQDAKAGATQGTAIYDVAMARHLLEMGDTHKLSSYLEAAQKAADLQKTHAEAQAAGQAGAADALLKRTQAHKNLSDAHTDRITAAIAALGALQPQPAQPKQQAQPKPKSQLPPGARLAPDGRHYVPDPDRPGKYLMVVPHQSAAA